MLLPIAYEGEGRDGYRDQIVTCDVGVSLNSKTHPLFMQYSNGTSTQCYAHHYPSLFPVLFLQSLYVPFNSQNFSFTCFNSTSPMDDVIMMSLGLYSNVWLGQIIIGTQVVEGLT